MEIQITDHKRVSVVAVSGRIDGSTAGEFEAALSGLISAGSFSIVLDMSAVEFVSSAGLRVLVNTRKTINSAGGRIVLAEPSQQVIDTLDIAGLDVLFEQFSDRGAAIGTY